MAHDVFISYSSLDKPTADAVCAKLEAEGVRCWIAPRDILPGRDWGEAIVDAIEASRLMVLVFSKHANASRQIKREVERAVNKGVTIVPVRIDDVLPAGNLEYFLGTPHWLDAITPPLEQHLQYLAQTIKVLMNEPGAVAPLPLPRPPAASRFSHRQMAALGGVALAVLVFSAWWFNRPQPAEAQLDPAFVGTFRSDGASDGTTATFTNTYRKDGSYEDKVQFDEAGTFYAYNYAATNKRLAGGATDPSVEGLMLQPSNGPNRQANWTVQGDLAVEVYNIIPQAVFTFIITAAQSSPSAYGVVIGKTNWTHLEGDTWQMEATWVGRPWKLAVTLSPNGVYSFHAETVDSGQFSAKDGKWRAVSAIVGISDGDYQFLDADTVAFKSAAGSTNFRRVKT